MDKGLFNVGDFSDDDDPLVPPPNVSDSEDPNSSDSDSEMIRLPEGAEAPIEEIDAAMRGGASVASTTLEDLAAMSTEAFRLGETRAANLNPGLDREIEGRLEDLDRGMTDRVESVNDSFRSASRYGGSERAGVSMDEIMSSDTQGYREDAYRPRRSSPRRFEREDDYSREEREKEPEITSAFAAIRRTDKILVQREDEFKTELDLRIAKQTLLSRIRLFKNRPENRKLIEENGDTFRENFSMNTPWNIIQEAAANILTIQSREQWSKYMIDGMRLAALAIESIMSMFPNPSFNLAGWSESLEKDTNIQRLDAPFQRVFDMYPKAASITVSPFFQIAMTLGQSAYGHGYMRLRAKKAEMEAAESSILDSDQPFDPSAFED